ncbi:MAG: HEPN domain-containing protein [Cytophagales bacterium]|nr:HEPN domain-containing protein [Cytophagales bacterium]
MLIEKILIDVKKAVTKLYGERLSKLILYGSQARGEATEYSDIDLLIVLKGRMNEKKETNRRDIIYDLILKYNEEISGFVVSENQYKTNNMPFYLNVRNDGIDLLKSGEILTPQKMKKIYYERKLKNNGKPFHENFRPMKFKKEIKILIDKSKREFSDAELLFKNESYEGSVSRCYYSIFHAAQAALLTNNIDPFGFQHKTIVSKFGELFIKTGIFPKDMSKYFIDTKDKREEADYDSVVGFISKEEAATKIENGKEFNQTIENYIQKEMKKEKNKKRGMEM